MALHEKNTHVPETVRQLILEQLRNRRFGTVREVIVALKTSGISETMILRTIQALAREGAVVLSLPGAPEDSVMAPVTDLKRYLRSTLAFDLWITLLLLALGMLMPFLIPSYLFPLVILRWLFAGLLLVFVPGFAFVRALFPFDRFIDRWERLALSCGLSVAFAVLVGFVLNFTPWGITPAPTAIVLAFITILSIIAATYRRTRILISPEK